MSAALGQKLDSIKAGVVSMESQLSAARVKIRSLEAEAEAIHSPEIARLTEHLHNQLNSAERFLRGHPDYEYMTIETGRKTCEDPTERLEGDGWEPNGEGHDSWERFDYTEDHHYRRLKPELRDADWTPPDPEK